MGDFIYDPEYKERNKALALRRAKGEGEGITSDDVGGRYTKVEVIPKITVQPHLRELFGSAYHIAEKMMKQLSEQDSLDSRAMTSYAKVVDALVKLSREEREQGKLDNPKDLSDEELEAMIHELVTHKDD